MPRVSSSRTKPTTERLLSPWLIVVIGLLLRLQYMIVTTPNIRSHDWSSHMHYVDFVAKNWSIPAFGESWEAHQAPLYYALVALWMKVNAFIGAFDPWVSAQIFSVILSGLATVVAVWIGQTLFPSKKMLTWQLLFVCIVALLPGLILFASVVSNDTLVPLITFAFTFALLRWWKSGNPWDWVLCSALVAVTFLVKINAGLTSTLVLLGSAVLRPGGRFSEILRDIGIFIVIATIGAGWFLMLRLQDGFLSHLFLSGTKGVGASIVFPYRIADFITFNPLRLIIKPFNDVWGDSTERRFFWEFLFRTVFSGEWDYPKNFLIMSSSIMVTAIGGTGLAIAGSIQSFRTRETHRIPLLLTFLVGVLTLLTFRLLHNASPNQDFRFVPQIILPVAAWICMGISMLPRQIRPWVTAAMFCSTSLWGAMIIVLSLA
jgi:hypothetical protein